MTCELLVFLTNYTYCVCAHTMTRAILKSYTFYRFSSAGDVPRIKELFPNARIHHIPGAGHWAHFEKPTEFLQLTREFLSSNTENKSDCQQTV